MSSFDPEPKPTLSAAEQLVYARQWYFDYMRENIANTPNLTFTFEKVKDALADFWNAFPIFKQRGLGTALNNYRAALKARDDATAHLDYAKAYRGAPDDMGERWRATIDYYERRRQGVVNAEADLAMACRDLVGQFDDTDEAEKPYVEGLAQKYTDSFRAMEAAMKKEMAGLKAAAEQRTKTLEKGNLKQEKQEDEKPAKSKKNRGGRGRGKGGKGGKKDNVPAETSPNLGALSLGNSDFEWKGRLALDEAGSDAVNLWLGVENERIRIRTVHKQVDLEENWNADHYWTNGAPEDASFWTDRSIPTELHAHKELTHPSGKKNVVQLMGYANEQEDRSMHLYLEWCPYGDVSSLVKPKSVYCSAMHGDRPHLPHEDFSSSSRLIPEPFCWAALLSMVKAGLLMERGQVSANGANSNWVTMVHRDLKVSNVFLGAPGQEFIDYPLAKVGDFGIVILVPSDDTRPAGDIGCMGTLDHTAPETMLSLTHPDGSYVRQSTKTNVWGVGMVLYSLLAGRFGPAGEDEGYLNFGEEDKREPPEFDTTTKKGYSQNLRDLVMACLRYEAKDRPTFDFLLEEISASTNGDQADLADKMRNLCRGAPEFAAKYQRHALSYRAVNKYAIGLSFDQTGFEDDDKHFPSFDPPPGLSGIA